MRIIYVARHRPGDWDEGAAISHALERLGHDVVRVPEDGIEAARPKATRGDFLLFHHLTDLSRLARFALPKVFWYFDLVDYPDPTLALRCAERIRWVTRATALCVRGFMNDGDWVAQDTTGKLRVLKEGVDARQWGRGAAKSTAPVLFVGSTNGGQQRVSCLDLLARHYGERFVIAGNHRRTQAWGRDYADLVAGAGVVIAPDGPVTDRYWSNRIYIACAAGALLVHPWSEGAAQHYEPDLEVVFYRDRDDMIARIDWCLERPELCREVSTAAMFRTLRDHTFHARCAVLVDEVRRAL